MSKTGSAIAFIIGAAAGSITSWQLLKKYYREQTEKEIDSVKKSYQERMQALEDHCLTERSSLDGTDPIDWEEVAKNSEKYCKTTRAGTGTDPSTLIPEIPKQEHPYIITADEFGELYDYNTYFLDYYADGIISDAEGNVLSDDEIEQAIGHDSLEHFVEGLVHVRNDVRHCDYEVTWNEGTYHDVFPNES